MLNIFHKNRYILICFSVVLYLVMLILGGVQDFGEEYRLDSGIGVFHLGASVLIASASFYLFRRRIIDFLISAFVMYLAIIPYLFVLSDPRFVEGQAILRLQAGNGSKVYVFGDSPTGDLGRGEFSGTSYVYHTFNNVLWKRVMVKNCKINTIHEEVAGQFLVEFSQGCKEKVANFSRKP